MYSHKMSQKLLKIKALYEKYNDKLKYIDGIITKIFKFNLKIRFRNYNFTLKKTFLFRIIKTLNVYSN